MLNFARRLTSTSACSYGLWCLQGRQNPLTVTTRLGARFELRPNSSGNNDYGVAYEVFVHEYYAERKQNPAQPVRLIVDLGANVGYSLLFYLHTYPNSEIIAFEPHPRHAAQARRNLNIDGVADRVRFYEGAVGASTRKMWLTDQGSGSTVTARRDRSIEVEVVDVFPLLDGKKIDLLKIDIEGGEYEILADPRFERLDTDRIVMEWHSRGCGLEDKRWCEERLQSLGYRIEPIFTESTHGMFHARRATATH